LLAVAVLCAGPLSADNVSDLKAFMDAWELSKANSILAADLDDNGRVDREDALLALKRFLGVESPPEPQVKDEVEVLAAGVAIVDANADSVTLSGDVPEITPGEVLVSAAGQGLLRKAVSVTAAGNTTVVQTAPATIEDVFEDADILVSKDLGADDFSKVTATAAGVRVRPGQVTPQGSMTVDFDLDDVPLIGSQSDPRAYVHGTASLTLGLNISIRVKLFRGVTRLTFGPYLKADFNAHLVAHKRCEFTTKTKIAEMWGTPFIIMAGPVPLVFTPKLHVYITFSGRADAGLEIVTNGSLSANCGIQYSGGWSTYSNFDRTANLPTITNMHANFSGRAALLCPEASIKLYGVAGPYVSADLPYAGFTYSLITSPPGHHIKAVVGVTGRIGAKVEILGSTLADCHFDAGKEWVLWDRHYALATGNLPVNITFAPSMPAGVRSVRLEATQYLETRTATLTPANLRTTVAGLYEGPARLRARAYENADPTGIVLACGVRNVTVVPGTNDEVTIVLSAPGSGEGDGTGGGGYVSDEWVGRDGGVYVWVPPGEFDMGDDDGGLGPSMPKHRVRITRGFWLSKYEVTLRQYAGLQTRLQFVRCGTRPQGEAITSQLGSLPDPVLRQRLF